MFGERERLVRYQAGLPDAFRSRCEATPWSGGGGPRPRPVPGDAAVEQAGVGVTLRWDPVPGRGRQTDGGGDDAGLGEELGQLKRGGRRPMSRTWALLCGRGRGHGRDFVQKQGEYIVNQGGPLDFNAESRIPEKA